MDVDHNIPRKQDTQPKTDLQQRRELLKQQLPLHVEPYTDKYFLRSKQILEAEGINPRVIAQVFIRKGPGEVSGTEEAVAAIEKYAPQFVENGGKIYALPEGSLYKSKDTQILIEGPLQDIVALETFYLGVLSRSTTARNDGFDSIDLDSVTAQMRKVVQEAEGRSVSYFGARHWGYEQDALIAEASFKGGATGASTDAGAASLGAKGLGTIPHVLENAYAAVYGKENAVVESTKAFDRIIDPEVPRIALIDYNNKEITDSLAVADALDGRLVGVRVDTPGENIAQGALATLNGLEAQRWRARGIPIPDSDSPDTKFWAGTGVTISGVYALRKALDDAGHKEIQIILTSGFGDPEKVKAFVAAEKILGICLFNGLGVGGVYKSRSATMDVVGLRDEIGKFHPLSKAGRSFQPNERLQLVLGKEDLEITTI